VQGGETSGNIDNKVRNAISQLADIHFVSHKPAFDRLIGMGVNNIYCNGCPSIDVIRVHGIQRKEVLPYVICCFHPHTNEINKVHEQALKVFTDVTTFCKDKNLKLYWLAPNNDPGFIHIEECLSGEVELIENMLGYDFLQLLSRSSFIIGNTSSCIRESSYLGVPSVVIGDRQKDRVMAKNAIACDFNNIVQSMELALESKPLVSNLFGDGYSSEYITRTLERWLNERKD
jgi:UDP-N-acetylglucosamine 2-epimerase